MLSLLKISANNRLMPKLKDPSVKKALLIISSSAALSLSLAFLSPKQYRSSAKIVIYNVDMTNSFLKEFSTFYSFNERRKLQEYIISNSLDQKFLERLAKENGLLSADMAEDEKYEFIARFRERFNVLQTETGAFQLTYTDSNRHRAQHVLAASVAEIQNVMASLTQAPIAKMASNIKQQLEATLTEIKKVSATVVKDNPQKATVAKELIFARERYSELLLTHTAKHPKVRTLVAKIKSLEDQLGEGANTDGTDDDTTFLSVAGIKKPTIVTPSIAGNQLRAGDISTSSLFTSSKLELLDTLQQTYGSLLKKYQDLSLAMPVEAAKSEAMVRVLDEPSLPKYPIKPNKKYFLLYGLLVGMFISIIQIQELRTFVTKLVQSRLK